VGELRIEIETPPDFEALLDACAARTPDNVDRIPYYATLWPSALGLAAALWQRRDVLAGTRAVELGCGLGLPAIVAARLGATVLATDFHPDAGSWLQRNAARNGVSLAYEQLTWGACPAHSAFDWVIGSDLLYERRHIASLATAITALAAPAGRALIADPGRDGLADFTSAMASHGWQSELEPHGEIYVLVFTR
jgi:predicted nicotinamide N-methyase